MSTLQNIQLKGEAYVLIPRTEYRRMRRIAEQAERGPVLPPFPKADARGYMPALEFAEVSMARTVIKERHALGLTQGELARLAGVRQETISRMESGAHSPTLRTVEKIDRALKRAAKRGGTAKIK